MKENVLDVLMFLFENYLYDEPEETPDRDSLEENLHQAGFTNGEIDKAFEWLDKALKERSHWLVWLKIDPRFKSLRNDKRFASLLEKIGIAAMSSVE